MNKFKVLYVLNVAALLMLMISVSTYAKGDNLIGTQIKGVDFENNLKLTGKVVEIEGLKFIEFLQNKKNGKKIYLSMDYFCPFLLEIGEYGYNENIKKGVICFSSPIKNNKGLLHFMEHLLVSCIENRKWFTLGVSDNIEGIGLNAYTDYLDEKNNIAEMELDLSEKFLNDEDSIKKLSKTLLGDADFLKNPEMLKDEQARIMIEQHGRRNLKEGDGVEAFVELEGRKILDKTKYDVGGIYDDIKNVSFDEVKDFYSRYIVDASPTLWFKFRNLKDAAKSVALFKKHYLDKKKNFRLTETGRDKSKKDFVEFEISPEYDKAIRKFEFFKEEKGNKKVFKTKNRVDVEFSVYDFLYYKKLCLLCINNDYFDNIKELQELKKKYGFEKIRFAKAKDTYNLSIFTNNDKILKEENIKKIVDEICEILINHINNKEIKLEDILSVRDMDVIKKQIEEEDYALSEIINNINMSYILEGKPFSKKFFKFNKEGKIENNPKVFEEYFKENYKKILKEIFQHSKRRFLLYKKKEGRCFKKAGFSKRKEFYLPIKFIFKTFSGEKLDSALQTILEEIIAEKVFNEKYKRLFYTSFRGSSELNRFVFPIQSNLEIETLRKICKKDLKKNISGLNLSDSYIDRKIKLYIDFLISSEKNLMVAKNSLEKKIESQKKLLRKKEIGFGDIEDLEEVVVNKEPIKEADFFLKIDYDELIKRKKIIEKNNKMNLEANSQAKDIYANIENRAKTLDKKAIKIYKKQLEADIKVNSFHLDLIKDRLKKMKELINGQAKKITKKDIKECLKNVVVEDFDLVNKRERKRDEDLDKLIKKNKN